MDSKIEYIVLKYLGVFLRDFWYIDDEKVDIKGNVIYNVISSYHISIDEIKQLAMNTLNNNTIINVKNIDKEYINLMDIIHKYVVNKIIEDEDNIIELIQDRINMCIINNNEIIKSYMYYENIIKEQIEISKHKEEYLISLAKYEELIGKINEKNKEYEDMLNDIININKNYEIERKKN